MGYSEGNFTVGQYEVCTKSSYQYDMQSPAVVRRGTGQWLMWSNNSDQNDGVAGWQNQNAFVELRQSQDGKTWGAAKSLKQSLILKGEGGVEYYIPWHLDVQWMESENEYWGLFCAYPKGGNTQRTYLLFATSVDGETWTSYPKPLISPTDGGWYNNFVYRSTFTYENGKLRVLEMSRNVQSGNTQNLKSSAAPVRLPAAPASTPGTSQAAAQAGCVYRP